MEFNERLASLATKVKNQASTIGTEEATKNAFVMPFISTILGYDVFDPLEVIPEFTADVGTKRGEKIDYAIVRDGEVQILIEAKTSQGPLKFEHASQLYRYFAVTNARIAALTNGVMWHFYTDLDQPNRMDSKPFLVLDLTDVDETLINEIQKLSKARAIACGVVKPVRITHRDAKSYFAVLLDDNNRKPVARLHFNGRQKYLGLLDEAKVETRHAIESLDEIYAHADEIRAAVARYT